MTGTISSIEDSDSHVVLGETLRPLLTNAMGSAIEIFDTRGPMNAGPLLTIVTRGNAARFFREVASEVEMSPPDIPGIVRVGKSHGVEFVK
jgi:hypothetical protein